MNPLKNSSFKEEFTYQEENIAYDINIKKRSMIIKIEKLYGLTPFL